uniref:Endonuclease/exonuclease/phosphatase domain-containing protein n=1 Tax=Lactuca sativa TaxID=4236 RepID=A0A9R1VCH2_LACSA|nr:hypothetical protein LSAT_V11C600329500 [Lactuca sativa]
MKILTINSRGVGCEVKREWIKTLRIKNHVLLLGIQEIKALEFRGKLDKVVWGSSAFLCETDPSTFKCYVTIKGQNFLAIKGTWITSNVTYAFINVYAPNDPTRRKSLWSNLENVIDSNDNIRWVVFKDFNELTRELGLYFALPLHNTSINSSLLWLLDDELEGVVKEGWVCSTCSGIFSSLSPLHVVAGKLKNTKEKSKTWRKSKNDLEQKRVEELTKEIDLFDTNAESHTLDESKIEYQGIYIRN